MNNSIDVIAEARSVFDKEILALEKTRDSLGPDFVRILDLLVSCRGKVILAGIGKPGHIGTKIAATLASLGTPAFFLHPAEALHGDLGMIQADDVVLLTSYSGESEEVIRLLPTLHEIGCVTVAITGNARSTLSRECMYRFVFP
jgi:arabinose-5-phosphate isomerase